ncbi:MAG: DUF4097 family beta strand repeat-containing protein [Vicinamibacterales bacterium]
MSPLTRLTGLRPLATAVLIAAAYGSTGCQINFDSGMEARDEWRRTYPLEADGAVEIRESNGRISVTGTDGNQVEVVAERIAKAPTEEAAKAALEDVKIEETISPREVVLDSTTKGPDIGLGIGSRIQHRVNYTVRVPRGARVTLRSANGAIEVTDVGGRVRIAATNGRITAKGLGDGAEITSTNGVITVEAASIGRGLSCETTNGVIDVTVPAGVQADLSARTTNGGISTDGLEVHEIEKTRRRLDATIGGGGPEIRLQTTNGMIRLRGR